MPSTARGWRKRVDRKRRRAVRGLRRWRRRWRPELRLRTARFRALPDFVVLGAARCGTTSLYEYLMAHPDVLPPQRKEVHYFDLRNEQGVDYYRSHFPLRIRMACRRLWRRSPVLTGEASPYYLFHPDVPQSLRAVVPDAKLIVLVRDPVERAYSHYRMEVRDGHETLDFLEAIRAEPTRLAGTPATDQEARLGLDLFRQFSYVERGMYAQQLERWFALFPRAQILVLKSEELFTHPRATYERVLGFLGLATDVDLPEFAPYNEGDRTSIPKRARETLEDAFREPNRRLIELVGIDFTSERPTRGGDEPQMRGYNALS